MFITQNKQKRNSLCSVAIVAISVNCALSVASAHACGMVSTQAPSGPVQSVRSADSNNMPAVLLNTNNLFLSKDRPQIKGDTDGTELSPDGLVAVSTEEFDEFMLKLKEAQRRLEKAKARLDDFLDPLTDEDREELKAREGSSESRSQRFLRREMKWHEFDDKLDKERQKQLDDPERMTPEAFEKLEKDVEDLAKDMDMANDAAEQAYDAEDQKILELFTDQGTRCLSDGAQAYKDARQTVNEAQAQVDKAMKEYQDAQDLKALK